ncbi:SMI1/KNR4 family protein [Streptosporangium sp. NPDC023963]|uniref:SMI1/KNR4 family protein n=1 Tax=Streptosporangium sp. NPDC023963 TaxID=3155608 RepID=UPI003437F4E1
MDLDVIRRGIDALREYDTDLDLFGAREHRYRFKPPLDEATLEDVETRIGVRFPADYRTFLTRLGNGGAGPYYGVHGVRPAGSWTRFGPFPFTEEWEPPTDDEGYLALYERRDGDARDLLARAHAAGAEGDHEAVCLALAEAVLLREEGRIADALTTVEHAIPRNGWWYDRSWLHRLRVELLLTQSRLDDACTATEEHIARCPDDDFGYIRRALLRVLAGDPSAAEEVLRADAPLGRGVRSAGHPRPADRTPVALRLRARRLAWECRRWGHATDAPRFDAIAAG